MTVATHGHERRHTFAERLLLYLSRSPSGDDYEAGREKWVPDQALSQLCRAFPDFMQRIAGKDVLDFGCGLGHQVVTLAKNGARSVVGVEINERRLALARNLSQEAGVAPQVDFATCLE